MTTLVPSATPPAGPLVDALVDLVSRGGVCALTGAGMSTASGIPDYRGPDGIRRVTPMDLAEFVRSDEGRQRYWARAAVGWRRFAAAAPNPAHKALAELGHRGYLSDVITQNVDGLHQRAGTTDLVELHGSLERVICRTCTLMLSREQVQAIIERDNPGHAEGGEKAALRPDGDVDLPVESIVSFITPRCPRCGSDELKPDVVFFGEAVPKERVARCESAVAAASLLLVLGSSVQVMSSYRFVRQALREGTPVAVVTRGRTRADSDQILKVDALVDPVLRELLDRVPVRYDAAPR